MDIHEVQIDDYVMFDGSVYQIEEISKKGWVHLTQDGNRVSLSSDYILDYLKGVPLTPEIIRKNGFEYHHKNFASLSYEHPFKLEEVECPSEEELGGLWRIASIIEVRFVHQLQHALRVCGIEKEIIIKK